MDDASRTRDRVRGRGRVGLGGGGARRRASVGVEEEGREEPTSVRALVETFARDSARAVKRGVKRMALAGIEG